MSSLFFPVRSTLLNLSVLLLDEDVLQLRSESPSWDVLRQTSAAGFLSLPLSGFGNDSVMLIELIPGDVCNVLGYDKPPPAGRTSIAGLARPPEVIKVHCWVL